MAVLLSFWVAMANIFLGSLTIDNSVSIAGDDIKVLLFCNQPNYVPGDTVFFSAYIIPKKAPVTGRHLLRLGLWNSDNTEVAGVRLWLNEGHGLDKLILPANMDPGVHTLVAYFEFGLSHESLVPYTTDFIVSGENWWAMDHNNGIDYDTLSARLSLSGDTLKIRQKVVAQLTGLSGDQVAEQTYMISIYKEDLFYPNRSVLHLLEAREQVFLTDSLGHFTRLKYPAFFSGVVFNPNTGQLASDSTRITFFLGKEDLIYSVYTGRNGRFSFPLFKPFEFQQIFYTISFKGKILHDHEIKIASPTLEGVFAGFTKTAVPDPLHSYNSTKRSIERSYKFFSNRNIPGATGVEGFSIDADIEVKLDKFDPFVSMEQLFGNVVPMVRPTKLAGQATLRVFLKDEAQYAQYDPVYIIDGVMTRNTEYLLSLDPLIVDRIRVLRTAGKLTRFGDLGRYGIIVVETKLGQAYDPNPSKTFTIAGVSQGLSDEMAKNQGVNMPQEFPDLRSVLYWYFGTFDITEPSIEFTTSNATGSFIIEIATIGNGTVFISRSRFYISN